jgi:hypothetical protein
VDSRPWDFQAEECALRLVWCCSLFNCAVFSLHIFMLCLAPLHPTPVKLFCLFCAEIRLLCLLICSLFPTVAICQISDIGPGMRGKQDNLELISCSKVFYVKGTVSEDISSPIFSIKRSTPKYCRSSDFSPTV